MNLFFSSPGVAMVMVLLMRFLAAIIVYTIVIGLALGCLVSIGYFWWVLFPSQHWFQAKDDNNGLFGLIEVAPFIITSDCKTFDSIKTISKPWKRAIAHIVCFHSGNEVSWKFLWHPAFSTRGRQALPIVQNRDTIDPSNNMIFKQRIPLR